jgi:hypothetical protein
MNENPTNADEQFKFGMCYLNGDGVPKDIKKAEYWLTNAAEQNHVEAQYKLGELSSEAEKYMYWYTRAAEQGDARSQLRLGLIYSNKCLHVALPLDELDVPAERVTYGKKAFYLFNEAAKQGYAEAQYELGKIYTEGRYCGYPSDDKFVNKDQARYWLSKAVEQDYEYAKEYLDNLDKNFSEHNKRSCYIATCVYGSYDCPEVWTLRRYRDIILSASCFGRWFINIYYMISPKIVELFGEKKFFINFCKPILNKFVQKLQNNGIDNSYYSD